MCPGHLLNFKPTGQPGRARPREGRLKDVDTQLPGVYRPREVAPQGRLNTQHSWRHGGGRRYPRRAWQRNQRALSEWLSSRRAACLAERGNREQLWCRHTSLQEHLHNIRLRRLCFILFDARRWTSHPAELQLTTNIYRCWSWCGWAAPFTNPARQSHT